MDGRRLVASASQTTEDAQVRRRSYLPDDILIKAYRIEIDRLQRATDEQAMQIVQYSLLVNQLEEQLCWLRQKLK